jgi:hypothetical protein
MSGFIYQAVTSGRVPLGLNVRERILFCSGAVSCILLLLYIPLLGLGRFFSFLILYTVGRTPWTGISPSEGLYLHTEQHKHNKRTQTDSNTRLQCFLFCTNLGSIFFPNAPHLKISVNCQALTRYINASYAVGHELGSSLMCVVPILQVLIIFGCRKK